MHWESKRGTLFSDEFVEIGKVSIYQRSGNTEISVEVTIDELREFIDDFDRERKTVEMEGRIRPADKIPMPDVKAPKVSEEIDKIDFEALVELVGDLQNRIGGMEVFYSNQDHLIDLTKRVHRLENHEFDVVTEFEKLRLRKKTFHSAPINPTPPPPLQSEFPKHKPWSEAIETAVKKVIQEELSEVPAKQEFDPFRGNCLEISDEDDHSRALIVNREIMTKLRRVITDFSDCTDLRVGRDHDTDILVGIRNQIADIMKNYGILAD